MNRVLRFLGVAALYAGLAGCSVGVEWDLDGGGPPGGGQPAGEQQPEEGGQPPDGGSPADDGAPADGGAPDNGGPADEGGSADGDAAGSGLDASLFQAGIIGGAEMAAGEFAVDGAPDSWNQLQGGAAHDGFWPVRTAGAAIKWRAEVGPTGYGSPVVSGDGTVYVATLYGELVALNPDGSERWRRDFFPQARILSTPAVDAAGNVYLVVCQPDDDDEFVCSLNKVSPQSNWLWTASTVGFTTASPTIYGGYIFLPFTVMNDSGNPYRRLFVFDANAREVASTGMGGCSNTVCGRGPDILGGLWDGLTAAWDFISGLPPCGIPCEFDTSGVISELEHIWLDPTIAVVPGADPGDPAIVIGVNNFCVTAFEFQNGQLELLWSSRLPDDDCDDPFDHSSPAVFANGMLVIGDTRGDVTAYDVFTGDKLWDYDAGEDVMALASSIGRQVYVVSKTRLHYLDYNGEFLRSFDLEGDTMASAVVSANEVYVSTGSRVLVFSLDLLERVVDHRVRGGYSAPAIGRDGTVYVATRYDEIVAYGNSQILPTTGIMMGQAPVLAP